MYNNDFKLFQRSNEAIWTDEHISKSLLEAHIDESHDAASRKYDRRLDIINWMSDKIKPQSKIIDLGCGPGLYACEFGKLGYTVLGIDFNIASIDYAQKNKCIKDIVEYKYCNYLNDTIEGNYDTAIMIYCDFGALIPNEQILLLNKIKNLLDDSGIFIFDVFGKDAIKDKQEKRSWYISKGEDFWSKDPYFIMEETKYFENESALGTRYYLVNQISHEIKEYIVWDQYYDEDSIKKLMLENGFETIEVNNNLLNDNGETLFVIAKK